MTCELVISRDIEVIELMYRGEDMFWHAGRARNPIVFEFIVRFAPGQEPMGLEPLAGAERHADRGLEPEDLTVYWIPPHEALSGQHTIRPPGFTDRLARWLGRRLWLRRH